MDVRNNVYLAVPEFERIAGRISLFFCGETHHGWRLPVLDAVETRLALSCAVGMW